ncbi:MAG: metalloregulator ArsR/SmtB family transcription factor [Hyphomonadaceae bacterium]|nr:metalloregulator ArsR/SmtB family transcription factor [Hyphomonadaceae bacterium]
MARPRRRADETRDVFEALADSNRRRALELLAGGEKSVQDLADHFPMSLAAVSQHLQVLHSAGIVKRREAGRRRYYAIDPSGVVSVQAWLAGLVRFWDGALERLQTHLDDQAR